MNRGLVALILMALFALPASAQADSVTAPVDTVAAPVVQPAPTPMTVDVIAVVRDLEARRQAALVAGDGKTLAEIMAEDATFAHSNGLMQTRAELITMLERGEIRYLDVKPEDVRYRTYGNTVVGTGVQSVRVKSAGKEMVLRNRYTVVYALTEAGAKMVAYQSTPMPKMSTRPR